MHHIKKAFCIVIGSFCMIFGILGAFFFGIAHGDLRGRVVGVVVGVLVALFGWWLTRLVEKKFSNVLEMVFDVFLFHW